MYYINSMPHVICHVDMRTLMFMLSLARDSGLSRLAEAVQAYDGGEQEEQQRARLRSQLTGLSYSYGVGYGT